MRHFVLHISMYLLFAGCGGNAYEVPSELQVHEHFVQVGDDSLYIRRVGQGAPILVLHGGPGMDHSYLLPHLDYLAQNHELIYYDQRASGRSSIYVPDSTIAVSQFVADIEAIRKDLRIPRLTMMGHSWGGLLAMAYAMEHASDVEMLILVNSLAGSSAYRVNELEQLAGRETPQDSMERMRLMRSDRFMREEVSVYEDLFRLIFKKEFYNKDMIDSLRLNFQPGFADGNRQLTKLGRDISTYDFHPVLEKLDIPTLILYGDYDPLSGDGAKALHKAIQGSELVILDKTGHFPFVESKEKFFPVVEAFLEKHGKGI